MEQGMDHTVLCKTVGERRSWKNLKELLEYATLNNLFDNHHHSKLTETLEELVDYWKCSYRITQTKYSFTGITEQSFRWRG